MSGRRARRSDDEVVQALYESKVTKMAKNLQKKGVRVSFNGVVLQYNDNLLGDMVIDSLEAIARMKTARGYVMRFAYETARNQAQGASPAEIRASPAEIRSMAGVVVSQVYDGTLREEFIQYLNREMNDAEFREKVNWNLCKMINEPKLKRMKNEFLRQTACTQQYAAVGVRQGKFLDQSDASRVIAGASAGDLASIQAFRKFNKKRSSQLFGYEPRDLPGYTDASIKGRYKKRS